MSRSPAIHLDGDTVVIRVPMRLESRQGRKEIIVPEGLGERSKSPTQETLRTALARAFYWQELVDSGRYRSVTELAEALGGDRSYFGRVMRLAQLAPDIVEAIVRGEEPSGLSLERLLKEIPVEWAKQRESFGFDEKLCRLERNHAIPLT